MTTPTTIRYAIIPNDGFLIVSTYWARTGFNSVVQRYYANSNGLTALDYSSPWDTEAGAIGEFDKLLKEETI